MSTYTNLDGEKVTTTTLYGVCRGGRMHDSPHSPQSETMHHTREQAETVLAASAKRCGICPSEYGYVRETECMVVGDTVYPLC